MSTTEGVCVFEVQRMFLLANGNLAMCGVFSLKTLLMAQKDNPSETASEGDVIRESGIL